MRTCKNVVVDDLPAGNRNLGAFVAATAGRKGTVANVPGGVLVAGPVPVVNGYVNAAIPTNFLISTAAFVDSALAFFADLGRSFVLWVPSTNTSLADEAQRRGGAEDADRSPAMSIHAPIEPQTDFQVSIVDSSATRGSFGSLAQRGYGIDGLEWLLHEHDSYSAEGATWAIVSKDAQPLGVACGFLNDTTGGVYYVATPREDRGRGVGAAATTWVTNRLFEGGARSVTLQSSKAGFAIYRRLGFQTYDEYRRFTFDPKASA